MPGRPPASASQPVCAFYTKSTLPRSKNKRFRSTQSHSQSNLSSLRKLTTTSTTSLFHRILPPRSSRNLRQLFRKANTLPVHILLFLPLLLLFIVEVPSPRLRTNPSSSTSEFNNPSLPLSTAITPIKRKILPGVSIVACCMNRHATLQRVLPQWRAVRNVSEIILVDWSSEPPLRAAVHKLASSDSRVRLIRVEGETQWTLTRAYNLGIRAASYQTVIRTDCDYSLDRNFVEAHPPPTPGVFYAGNYNRARNENEVHLNGAVYIRRDDFLKIGGYDERIQTYGWDDEDLYNRLQDAKMTKMNISYDHVKHVPHDDDARAQKDVKFVQVEIDLNSILLKGLPKWNSNTSATSAKEWRIVPHTGGISGIAEDNRYTIVKAAIRPKSLKDIAPPRNVTEAWNTALGQRLANDYQVPWDIMVTMDIPQKRKLLTKLNLRMRTRSASNPCRILFAHVMHGLGNRMRALGSAMSFAKETGRELVIIWETDAHISANFSDLFKDDDYVVITRFMPKWPFRDADKWDKSWLTFEFFNYMEMEKEGAIKGQRIVDKPEKHFYFKSAYIMEAHSSLTSWNKDNTMLRSLQPVDEVMSAVRQHEHSGIDQMIGIHIRDRTLDRDIKNVNFGAEYGDSASKEMEYWRKKSSYRTFIPEMQRLVQENPTQRFYIATDTLEVIPKLQAEFPGKIVHTPRNCDGRDGKCIRYALVDILCLGKTKELIGSNWSSFTEAASRIGGKRPRLAGKHFATDPPSSSNQAPSHDQGSTPRTQKSTT